MGGNEVETRGDGSSNVEEAGAGAGGALPDGDRAEDVEIGGDGGETVYIVVDEATKEDTEAGITEVEPDDEQAVDTDAES